MEKEKKEIKISLWTFYVLVAAVVVLIGVVIIGGFNSIKKEQQVDNTIIENNEQIIEKNDTQQVLLNKMQKIKKEMEVSEETIYSTYDEGAIKGIQKDLEWMYSRLENENNTIILTKENDGYSCTYNNERCKYIETEINTELNEIYLETNEDKDEVYIALAFQLDDESVEIKGFTPYKINGINGKVKKTFIALNGHDNVGIGPEAFVLMEDGTLKYINYLEGIQTGKFNAYECKGIGKIDNIFNVKGTSYDEDGNANGGWMGVMLKKADLNYYVWEYANSNILVENSSLNEWRLGYEDSQFAELVVNTFDINKKRKSNIS